MSIISILVGLLIIGVLLWAADQLPLDPTIKQIIKVVAIVAVLIWILQSLGLVSGLNLR